MWYDQQQMNARLLRMVSIPAIAGAVITLAIIAVAACGHPGVVPATPGSVSAPIALEKNGLITVLPADLYNGFVLVHAEVDGLHGTFMLDTGSPVVVLNDEYVRPLSNHGVDTVKNPSDRNPDAVGALVDLHTIVFGTATHQFGDSGIGPPRTWPHTGMIGLSGRFRATFNQPILGTIGLTALEPFETIIDYVHRQVILIRLDSAGRRMVPVPRFVAQTTIPLIPVHDIVNGDADWWGVQARLGGVTDDTLIVDTGNWDNTLTVNTFGKLAAHLQSAGPGAYNNGSRMTLDHLVLNAIAHDTVTFTIGNGEHDMLGFGFLRRQGVVGLNLRKRQLMFYR
jgi:hypothetical protein